ncbi:hypothetical protein M9458_032303, partial [Cirrhinus mrigala]
YKASELESLCEGQTLMVGGKQIEVMGVISDEDYAKGRCFQDAAVETPAETVLKAPVYRPVEVHLQIVNLTNQSVNPDMTRMHQV